MTQLVYEKVLEQTKRARHMVMTNFTLSLLGWIGIPLFGIGWLLNMDNVKSAISFIVGISLTLLFAYFKIKFYQHKKRMQDMDFREREIEMKEREDYFASLDSKHKKK